MINKETVERLITKVKGMYTEGLTVEFEHINHVEDLINYDIDEYAGGGGPAGYFRSGAVYYGNVGSAGTTNAGGAGGAGGYAAAGYGITSNPDNAVKFYGKFAEKKLAVGKKLFTHPQQDDLQAENDRLREALQQIADVNSMMDIDTVESLARKTLSTIEGVNHE